MLSSVDVHNRLQGLDIQHEIFKLDKRANSLEHAAGALGLELSQLAKVEAYHIDGEPVMVIIPGDREVDPEKLRSVTGGERLEEISQQELSALSGYLSGATPPVGHQTDMTTYIDYYTLREDVVYTGSGDPTAILKIRSYDLVRATGGEIVDVIAPLE